MGDHIKYLQRLATSQQMWTIPLLSFSDSILVPRFMYCKNA